MILGLTRCGCARPAFTSYRFLVTPQGVRQCDRCMGLRFSPGPPFKVRTEGGMVGKVYLEKGKPVTVLAQWRGPSCPKNVVIADASGRTKVRPARGLRLP